MYPRFLAVAFLLIVSAMTLGVGQPSKDKSPVKTGQDYVFLFYNTNFSRGWTALPDTETEIQKLATELKDNYNFEVEPYVNLNLTALRKRLAEINRRPFGPNDQVLFFFSSHGYYQAGSDRGYLIPTDGPASWNFGQGWLSYDELREYLSANTAKHVLVGLDACHSGSFGKRTKGVPTSLPWQKDADCETIARSSLKRKSRLYFSSGNRNERTPAKSEFLSRWLQCLQELPDKGNYVVDNRDLHNYINTVSTSTPENGTFVGDGGGGFVFVHREACAPKVDPIVAVDNAHWTRVERVGTAVKAKEHIDLFGTCAHYAEALRIQRDEVALLLKPFPTSIYQMEHVPGGDFQMGDTFGDGNEEEKPVHTVTVSSFNMGRYEVTFKEYDEFTTDTGKKKAEDIWGRGHQPVINVSWFDAISYCNWLSSQIGSTPVYSLTDRQKQSRWAQSGYGLELDDDEGVLTDLKANGYRLPTEAEWEFAASYIDGRRKARFGSGKDIIRPAEANFIGYASYAKSYSEVGSDMQKTVKVGSLNSPNELGIHDLAGNVWEWCGDWYNENYHGSPKGAKNSTVRLDGTYRVLRGGSWYSYPDDCRSAYRGRGRPKLRSRTFGFRLARSFRE